MTAPEWVVNAEESGSRLDKFLAAGDRLGSRGQAVTALERGKVFVNGDEVQQVDAARRLTVGETVKVWVDRPGSARRRGGRVARVGEAQIVFDDGELIVVNKPAGLLTVPLDRRAREVTVQDQLGNRLKSSRARKPLVVHRIDRDTSGLVVFAMRAGIQQQLKDQFRRHEPERIYMAVVYGSIKPPAGTWRDRLSWDEKALIQRAAHPADPRAKTAVSEYRVVETFRHASLIEVRLVTGKRNQIRIQASLRGHPLVGERQYVEKGEARRAIAFPRQALHAARLQFDHPVTGRRVSFEAPVPADMAELIASLRPR